MLLLLPLLHQLQLHLLLLLLQQLHLLIFFWRLDAIPHASQMSHELLRTPRIDLSVQGCSGPLLGPIVDILLVRKLCAIQEVVPLKPLKAAYPAQLAGEADEGPPPMVHPPSPLDHTGG